MIMYREFSCSSLSLGLKGLNNQSRRNLYNDNLVIINYDFYKLKNITPVNGKIFKYTMQ